MMATEATSEKPVDVSVTEALLTQTDSTEPDSHNAGIPSPPVNVAGPPEEIENKQIADIVDELVNSTDVSVNGGSDTETSKANKNSDDDKGHARTSSTVKKPQSFKSVSVNRTFLAAKGAANTTSRPESAAASVTSATPSTTVGSSASKLKLVAKSGSSLGGSSKNLSTNGKPLSAPDPSTVWNRNRPVPTPEPKKLSDEELMSKYGIHMADRLRPEDDRGQSNWADIDDDEEWAPDTITWTDGTKITLPQVDDNPPTPSIAPAVPVSSARAKEPIQPEKPKSPAPIVSSGSAKASPSIKPGVLASGKGLVLKGAPEKPTLVAKAPAPPTPVKSPWAPLPPIDKASPVVTEIPNQQINFRAYPPRDGSIAKSNTPPPAKEIAADDFSRAPWRDGQTGGGNRELFNSQSGRYEPVNDRRGSRHEPRQDPHAQRQPALLQRIQPHDHQGGPAEPSAAFQTSRNSGQDAPPYGRRRGSSNVSGGSGGLVSRIGKPFDMPPPDGPPTARTGSAASGAYSPIATQHTPRLHSSQPWQPKPSPVQAHAVPYQQQPVPEPSSANVPTAGPSENDVELQKRLMRERREMAIKRRQEEEAREEAARKERIRLKLEAMGPAPERKSTKKEETKDLSPQIQQRASVPAALTSKEELAAAADGGNIDSTASSPALPTLGRETSPTKADAQSNGIQRGYGHVERAQGATARSGPVAGAQPTAPWPEAHQSNERLSTWSSGPQPSSRNVWAAPGNDRSLGNGTFNADLGNLADSQPAQPASLTSRPAPIGPPRSVSQGQQQRADQPPSRLAPIGPPSSRPGPNQTQAPGARPRNLWATADIAADDRAIRLQNHKRIEEMATHSLSLDDAPVQVRDTWRGVTIGQDGKRITHGVTGKAHGDSKEGHSNASWNAPETSRPDRHEPVVSQDYRQHHGADGMRAEMGRQPPIGPNGTAAPGPISHTRAGSRFFPQSSSRDIRQEEAASQHRSKSPTPPPPTMGDHPAYDGDVARPHVALPPTKPIVKLPPSAAAAPAHSHATAPVAPPKPAAPISFAAAAAAAPLTGRPGSQSTVATTYSRGAHHGGIAQKPHELATQENWQEKINNLVNRNKSVSSVRPMTVDSSSKSAFDAHTNNSATVSLPSLSPAGSTTTENSCFTSREMAEECFGEQEMGSLPLVQLPNRVPDSLWPGKAAEPNWLPLHAKYRVDATVAEAVRFPHEFLNNKSMVRVLTPGMEEARMVQAPFSPRNRSNPKRQLRGGRHVSRGGGQRGGRDNGDQHSTSNTERHERLSSSRGRGTYRGRSENWSRHSAGATQATQS